MKLLAILLLFLFGVLCRGRTVNLKHPQGVNWDDSEMQENSEKKDLAEVSLHKVSPPRFVPVNSIRYFKSMEPCEEGFMRDVLGVCREVWD